MSIHAMAAGFTGAAELNIDTDEAGTISKAIADVASHYSVTADPKTMAWVNLAAACGMVYGPRIGAIKLRRSMNKPSVKAPIKASASHPQPGGVVEGRFPLKVGDAPIPNAGIVLPEAVTSH